MTKWFAHVLAVADFNLGVAQGDFFSILGPSGCGKTTVLRMIAGFEQATSGRVRLDGIDVSKVPPYRRNVNTVFQHHALFPHLSVFENVAFGPRSKGLADGEVRKRVGAMLEIVRLGDLAGRRPDQLSGGQRQRVALARALVNFPSALLLDEPLSALDRSLRQAMQLELKRIQREVGIAFVFVTHDQEEALAMSDRIAVMNEGRIEQSGTPEAVYDAPASLFVAGFIGSANLLPGTVSEARGGRMSVALACGTTIEVDAAAASFAPGDGVVVMIRPERIRLEAHEPDTRASSMPVVLAETVFQGPMVRCVLRDSIGAELCALVPADSRTTRLEPGTRLWPHWETGVARAFRRDR